MSRHIELAGEVLRIRFTPDEHLLSIVRALPERRFDGAAKAWTVPVEHVHLVLARLEPHRFKFSPAVRDLWDAVPADTPVADGLTVAQVNERVRRIIEREFDESFWMVGELQGFDRNGKKSHAFFQLVERPRPNADPVAEVQCICYRTTRVALYHRLKEFPDIEFRDGLNVRLLVKPTLYPKKGTFQLVMEDLDPHFTAGEIQRRREAVINAMRALGIAGQNRGLPMPLVPLRVALITSESGDARRDFEVELRQSGFQFSVEVFDAAMQGIRTEETVVSALARVAARVDEFDVVCLVRGGGARSDLSFFDTELVARTACELPLKLIVGVGHQRDRCALDELAESVKTPTAAASLLVARVSDFHQRLIGCSQRLQIGARRRLDKARGAWREAAYGIGAETPRRLRRSARNLEVLTSSIVEQARLRVQRSGDRLKHTSEAVERTSNNRTRDAERNLSRLLERLSVERIHRIVAHDEQSLGQVSERLERAANNMLRESGRGLSSMERAIRLVHPDRVVERGYVLVRSGGQLVTRAGALAPGEAATLTFRDGSVDVTTDTIHPDGASDD